LILGVALLLLLAAVGSVVAGVRSTTGRRTEALGAQATLQLVHQATEDAVFRRQTRKSAVTVTMSSLDE
jgi:hypothetical protein